MHSGGCNWVRAGGGVRGEGLVSCVCRWYPVVGVSALPVLFVHDSGR